MNHPIRSKIRMLLIVIPVTALALAGYFAATYQTCVAAEDPEQQGEPNQLIDEKSPYLLQHAYNPVDWYPWGEEAFARAKKEDKPIFLSVTAYEK